MFSVYEIIWPVNQILKYRGSWYKSVRQSQDVSSRPILPTILQLLLLISCWFRRELWLTLFSFQDDFLKKSPISGFTILSRKRRRSGLQSHWEDWVMGHWRLASQAGKENSGVLFPPNLLLTDHLAPSLQYYMVCPIFKLTRIAFLAILLFLSGYSPGCDWRAP